MAVINGTSGSDTLEGTQDGDNITALAGNDVVRGLALNDLVNGNQGADTISGGQGADTIYGGRGNDSLRGAKGTDALLGGAGDDTLWGDLGADTLTGGDGSDAFVLASSQDTDRIVDFSSGDSIALAGNLTFGDLNISGTTENNAVSTVIQDRLTGQVLAILTGVDPGAIAASNFRTISDTGSPSQSGQASSSFDIRFDYRYDTNGFFSDPQRRAALEAAANTWESIIKDEFPDIPVGTPTPFVGNPQTDVDDTFVTDTPIDDLLVFVGSRNLGEATLAVAGPSGFSQSNLRYTGSNFEPWIGSISFDAATNWFFDPTLDTAGDIPSDAFDFYSIALHELAHVLGFGTSQAFTNLVSVANPSFNGDRVKAANGGNPVPLSPAPDLGHFATGYRINGVEPLMDATASPGMRDFATSVDIAALADIGYII
ncbi:hypothetical protein [Pseudanabaena sp. PCC 6802]|uniref:hypothetical protein n=1 Tax=Pseudanabaena sp. PCC 6802 TaxID=118173 RepID=UPI00034910F5|nr:hypothetical protein [Pseudanabaena sp. PCC 6802]